MLCRFTSHIPLTHGNIIQYKVRTMHLHLLPLSRNEARVPGVAIRWWSLRIKVTNTHADPLWFRLSCKSWSFLLFLKHQLTNKNQRSMEISTHELSSVWWALPKKKDGSHVLWLFSLVHVPSTNMDETGLITYTAASHQVVMKTLRLHFGEHQCHLSIWLS